MLGAKREKLRIETSQTAISGRKVSEFGTVRRNEAEVLTAKMTAILSDIGDRQRT
jgi:hypothetical protein